MSHLTADAIIFAHIPREMPDVAPSHASPPQGVPRKAADLLGHQCEDAFEPLGT